MRARIHLTALIVASLTLVAFGWSIAEAGVSGVALASAPAERAATVSGTAPVLAPISDMTVNAGQTADQAITATDSDGEALSFFKGGGPAFMSVTTTDPGGGSATGNLHLAPAASEDGSTTASVGVTDGQLSDQKSFLITVVGTNVAPVLTEPANMAVNTGEVADQVLTATDANGDPLSFGKAAGPAYMTVTTTDPGSGVAHGNVHLAPGSMDAGQATAAVSVDDGFLANQKSFTINVTRVNIAPYFTNTPDSMSVQVGSEANQILSAFDSDNDPLQFSKVSGPAYMAVTTTDPGPGYATGNIQLLNPAAADVGSTTATVMVSDGALNDQKSLSITVTPNENPYHAPYFYNPVYSMSVQAGSTADQTLFAYDEDGDLLEFSKVSGPAYMTVTTTNPGPWYGYGNIHLAPSAADVGSTTATVMVSDGALNGQQSLTLTVYPADQPPVMSQPANMTATTGESAEQTVTATDPDGNYMYIYMESGPSYMTVSGFSGYGQASAIIRIAPGANDAGTTTGSVTAYSNGQTDTKSFTITITTGNFPPPCGQGSFTAVTSSFGFGLIELQTADLNGDGVLDLVVEIPGSDRAATALGNGDGSFGAPTNLDAGSNPVSGAIADFNRDSFLDLAILDSGSGTVYVFLGDGAGAFGSRRGFTVGSGTRSMVAADINRDGKVDLLVTNQYSNSVSILRGNGDGTFMAATSVGAGYAAWHLATPDLNGDGVPDLVVVNPGDNDISVYRNNGSGVFGSRIDYPVGEQPLAVSPADLNGDGKIDLAITNSYSNNVMVFPGNGDGTLGAGRTFSTGYGPRQIAIEDLNGDGHLDLATANFDSYSVSILLGDGTGRFGSRSDIPVGDGAYGMASGDFNDDLRPDLAVASYYSGTATILLNSCAPARDHPPVVKAPKTATGSEGTTITFFVTANDPDGPAITSLTANMGSLPVGNNATFTPDPQNSGGVFAWTPGFQDARVLPYDVTFTATNTLSSSATTKITVLNVNRAPIANAGGPYTAFAGYPLTLDGSGSTDPDGDALSYLWVFGDGKSGTGVNPVHTYAALGVYGIALTVSDGVASDLATTTANIVGIFAARAFTSSGNRSIHLGSGKPQWCANVEPIGKSYSNVAVDLTSIVMKSPGTGSVSEIHALANKVSVGGDHDGNGVEEIAACFSKGDLRLLFANLHGNATATVTIEGRLFTGGIFRAQMDVSVLAGGGGPLAASLSPNPLNPEAILTFVTQKAGPARVEVFDLAGRLVRRLMDERDLPAGYHDVRITARGENGGPVASGVYFYRIEVVEGSETGRFTILK